MRETITLSHLELTLSHLELTLSHLEHSKNHTGRLRGKGPTDVAPVQQELGQTKCCSRWPEGLAESSAGAAVRFLGNSYRPLLEVLYSSCPEGMLVKIQRLKVQ
jgi:hypothetical protein